LRNNLRGRQFFPRQEAERSNDGPAPATSQLQWQKSGLKRKLKKHLALSGARNRRVCIKHAFQACFELLHFQPAPLGLIFTHNLWLDTGVHASSPNGAA
jgi:hypothetical protein